MAAAPETFREDVFINCPFDDDYRDLRTQLDPTHQLPRFNMPLELGIFLGARQYGKPEQRQKKVLIFDIEPFRFQKFVSDLAGMDIHAHDGRAEVAISRTRDWLVNVTRSQLPGSKKLIRWYHEFIAILPAIAGELDLDATTASYFDFEEMLLKWLENIKGGQKLKAG